MNVTTLGLDIAKSVFFAHGVDKNGKVVMQRKLTRGKVREFFAKTPPCLIGIEATGSAHYSATAPALPYLRHPCRRGRVNC